MLTTTPDHIAGIVAFPDGERVDLRLVDATSLATGVVSLTYRPAGRR